MSGRNINWACKPRCPPPLQLHEEVVRLVPLTGNEGYFVAERREDVGHVGQLHAHCLVRLPLAGFGYGKLLLYQVLPGLGQRHYAITLNTSRIS